MDWLPGLVVLVGFAVRIGIPVLITLLLAWLLRRLDARWQAEAQQQTARRNKRGTGAPRQMPVPLSRTPCWSVRGCPPEKREMCPAYARPEVPCWQIFRGERGQLRSSCLGCQVFSDAPVQLIG